MVVCLTQQFKTIYLKDCVNLFKTKIYILNTLITINYHR